MNKKQISIEKHLLLNNFKRKVEINGSNPIYFVIAFQIKRRDRQRFEYTLRGLRKV